MISIDVGKARNKYLLDMIVRESKKIAIGGISGTLNDQDAVNLFQDLSERAIRLRLLQLLSVLMK